MAFAVIDFETTGLLPERFDRVIEVGVVLVDDAGKIEHEWTSLVNPRRDVGPTRIHGLRAADLLDAPEFDAIADHVLELVFGRAVVAHNANFDMRFLHAELNRAGYRMIDRPAALCSMKWAGRLVGPAKLQHVCEALSIPIVDAHAALADARATAALLAFLMRNACQDSEWVSDTERSRTFAWPSQIGKPRAKGVARRDQRSQPNAWLDVVLNATWIPGVPENEAAYLLVLERALLDRRISGFEAQELMEVASRSRLGGESILRLHRDYLRSVAQEALADGVVTTSEEADLRAIAGALGLTQQDVTEALAWAFTRQPAEIASDAFALESGDRIVFTGEISRARDEWVAEIVRFGLATGGVTKSTKLVVAADPDSMSGKAAKARDYGIPIVDEATFARLFGIYCAWR